MLIARVWKTASDKSFLAWILALLATLIWYCYLSYIPGPD